MRRVAQTHGGVWPFALSLCHTAPNNAINADSKKRRSFVAPLFDAGYGERSAQ